MFSFQALYAAGRFEQALVEFHRALRSFQSFISWLHTNQFAWPILRILICSPKTKYFSANFMWINFNIFNIQASLKQPLWGMDQQVKFSFFIEEMFLHQCHSWQKWIKDALWVWIWQTCFCTYIWITDAFEFDKLVSFWQKCFCTHIWRTFAFEFDKLVSGVRRQSRRSCQWQRWTSLPIKVIRSIKSYQNC